jgi:hypothetical protein
MQGPLTSCDFNQLCKVQANCLQLRTFILKKSIYKKDFSDINAQSLPMGLSFIDFRQ